MLSRPTSMTGEFCGVVLLLRFFGGCAALADLET